MKRSEALDKLKQFMSYENPYDDREVEDQLLDYCENVLGMSKEWEPEDDESLEINIPKCDFCSSPCGFEHCSAKNDKGSVIVKPKRGR